MRGLDKSPQGLVARAIAGFPPVAENGIKVALTTGMTTDRKIFIFTPRRGIMAETEYPGVAQLVGRDIWDVEVGCSSHLTRTKIPLKSLISEGFFLLYKENHRQCRWFQKALAMNRKISSFDKMKMFCQPRTKNQRRNQVQMKLDVSSLAHTKWECK